MKVRDLLNTPLDELPKKIKVEDKTYTLFIDEDTDYHYYQDDECKYFMFSINCFEKLNDEIEVIEKDKKIRKITLLGEEIKLDSLSNWLKDSTDNEEKIASCIERNAMKINEIIDYLMEDKDV